MKEFMNEVKRNRELQELQRLFLQGKITQEDMTPEQVVALGEYLQSQIDVAERNVFNKRRKILKALLKDKNTIYLLHQFHVGEIEEEELTRKEAIQLNFLYDMEIQKIKSDIQNLKIQIG